MIDAEDMERLKEIFVTRRECDAITDGISNKQSENEKKLAVIETQLKTIGWVSKTTLAAVITAIIGAVMMLILK